MMSEGVVLSPGSLISNRYRVLSLIGGGAMAHVYKVEHIQLGTQHALKEQRVENVSDGTENEAVLEIAQREARFLTTLSHPSLPKVTDFFREGGNIYLVMDYVEGQNLKNYLDIHGQALEIPTVLRWGIQICDVLTYLHNQNPPVIFRDIKPSNLIRRPDDQICLVDFGIARHVRKGAPSDTTVLGSPGYAPPEQYGQSQTDPRSDIYALGATLHHLLTGRDPSLTPFKWPSPRSLNPLVPLVLEKLVMKCLDIEAGRRPESAEAVGRALRTTLQMYEEATRTVTTTPAPDWEDDMEGIMPPRVSQVVETISTGPLSLPVAAASASASGPDRVTFIPAGFPARPDPSASRTTGQTEAPATRKAILPSHRVALNRKLYQILFFCALFVVVGGIVFPFFADEIGPAATATALPTPPGPFATAQEREIYLQRRTQAERANAEAAHDADVYHSQATLRYSLDALICLAFFFGVVRPMRPTRLGMILSLGGALGLICLTAATFLPDRLGPFLVLALLEFLLLLPPALLLTTDLE
jgi:serine/threonine protein kinase